jgi:hypothetical protein
VRSHPRGGDSEPGLRQTVRMDRQSSDSQEQRDAERLILDGVERTVNEKLASQWLALHAGSRAQVDGVSDDESVLVEIFAHQGQLKGGQRHKIAGDALKLITLAREREPRPRLILAFADARLATWAAGKSWLATSLAAWNIEVMVVKLDGHVRSGIRAEQARQVMVNPAPRKDVQPDS